MELVTNGSSKGQENTREEVGLLHPRSPGGAPQSWGSEAGRATRAATHSSEEPSAKLVLGI